MTNNAQAELTALRQERNELIAEMNQRAVDARNDRQRLYEKVWAREAELTALRTQADRLAVAMEKFTFFIDDSPFYQVKRDARAALADYRANEQPDSEASK